MNRRSNKKYFIILLILLLGITIGYAALNSTLNINGRSNISKNTWDVHFDNVIVKDGSVEAIKIPTVTDKTTVDFEVNLYLPGDFYEFTVDVVNNGTIDAMIDNIEKTPDLSTEQQKYLNYIIEYQNEEQITTKQLVKSNEFVKIKVRVEYIKDISASDLPKNTETLNLGFNVNYVQADESGITVTDNGVYYPIKIISGDYNTVGSEIAIGNEHFYVISSDEDSVTMLTKYNLYVGSECSSSNSSSCIAYADAATGRQDSTMLGYESTTRKGITTFSNTNYWYNNGLKSEYGTNYPVYVYDSNSILYSYVENYKTYLSTLGVTPIDARLITYEELESLGCSADDMRCHGAPSWVYATTYWTGSADSASFLWLVYSRGSFLSGDYSDSINFGCRPVIVIPKSYISNVEKKQVIQFTINDTTYQAEEGMTWRQWVESEYDNDEFYHDQSEQEIEWNDECLGVSTGGTSNTVNPNDIIENNKSYSFTPVRC